MTLEDLPAEFAWVSSFSGVPRDSNTGVVEGIGASITLGNVHFQENGSALVSASLYIANLTADGLTHIVERVDGVWQIVRNTGVKIEPTAYTAILSSNLTGLAYLSS